MEISKYKTLGEWARSNRLAHNAAKRMGLIEELCEKFGWNKRKVFLSSTKEECLLLATECKTKTKFIKTNPRAYATAYKNGWMKDICKHMEVIEKPNGRWDKKICLLLANECKTRGEFAKTHPRAYAAAKMNGWFEEACKHMTSIERPKGFWKDKKNIREAVLLCDSKLDFQKRFSGGYIQARKNKWLDEFFPKSK